MKSPSFRKPFLKYILLIFFFTRTRGERFRCDYKYISDVRGWLKFQEIPATWYDARLRCALEGAILASPTTHDLRTVLNNWITKESNVPDFSVFIGIHSTFSNGDYYSVGGVPLAQIKHKWAKSEPNNLNNEESCLTLNSEGLFSDVTCNKTRPYFCFKPGDEKRIINECGTEDPEYLLYNETKSCYKFHTVARSFGRANLACSAEGGYLAIINSLTEANVISEVFDLYPADTMIGTFWKEAALIGFSNWGENGEWRTIHGKTLPEAGYDKFATGEPNNEGPKELCGSVYRNAQLNDVFCDDMYAFICEKDPKYPPICSAADNTN